MTELEFVMAGGVRGFVAGVLVASIVGVGGLAVVRATSGSSSASSFVPVTPVRVLDTRSDLGLVEVTDGVPGWLTVTGPVATLTSNGVVNSVVVPAGATAVVLNVTAVNPTAGGYVSLRPGDATGPPTVSTLNVTAGGTFPNGATITVPTTGTYAGQIQVWYEAEYTTVGSTELLIDIAGYYELASTGAGATGPAGAKGDTGATGPAGAKGDTGAAGTNGTNATVAITQQSVCDGTDADVTADELCKIGMTGPGGGIIFFVDYNDQYAGFDYLEAAPQGWSNGLLNVNLGGVTGETAGTATVDPKMKWCSDTSSLLGLNAWDKRAVGIGGTNTTTADTTCTSGAVQAASDLVLGGKDDWVLGSLGEMKLMYDNLQGVGGFSADVYWGSSEYVGGSAWVQSFFTGDQSNGSKNSTYYVRPVRAF
ncbi:MAG: hypothetical protein O3B15_08915 [Actinomycetota bacterium]|nr:hypothetical protein [Actinomycetota bacterium]